MIRTSLRMLAALAASLCLWGGVAPHAAAQSVTIGVSPARLELSAPPGAHGSHQITVSNDGKERFRVFAEVTDYKGAVAERSATDWLRVEPAAFDLGPGERQAVTVTVAVPGGLPPGGRYAMVAFTTGATQVAGNGTAVAGRVGVPLLLAIEGAGGIGRRAEVEQIVPLLEPDGRTGFVIGLANRGDLHVAARGGAVEVLGPDGSPVGRLTVPQSTPILPGMSESLKASGPLTLAEGVRYSARATVDYGGPQPAVVETAFAARAALAVENVEVREQDGREPLVRLRVRNTAELGVAPRIQLELRDGAGRSVGSATPARPPFIRPGEAVEIEDTLPQQLGQGEYVLAARVEYGSTAAEGQAAFRIGASGPAARPASGQSMPPFVPGNAARGEAGEPAPAGGLLPLFGAAAAMLVGAVLLVARRRHHRVARTQALARAMSHAGAVGRPEGGGSGDETRRHGDAEKELSRPPTGTMASSAVDGPFETAVEDNAAALLLSEGQRAAREGDRALAHHLFKRAAELDPASEEAWVWRAGTASQQDEVADCLRRALRINPDSTRARRGLEALGLGPSAA